MIKWDRFRRGIAPDSPNTPRPNIAIPDHQHPISPIAPSIAIGMTTNPIDTDPIANPDTTLANNPPYPGIPHHLPNTDPSIGILIQALVYQGSQFHTDKRIIVGYFGVLDVEF